MRAYPVFIQGVSSMRSLLLLCLATLTSYQQKLVAAASSFLETLVTLSGLGKGSEAAEAEINRIYGDVVLQCLKSVSDHNAYHLVYETSATPLSLLFALYEYKTEAFWTPFSQFFYRIKESEGMGRAAVTARWMCEW